MSEPTEGGTAATIEIPEHFRSIPEYVTELETRGEKINGLRAVADDKRDAEWETDVRKTKREVDQLDLELRAVQTFQQAQMARSYEEALSELTRAFRGENGEGGPLAALADLGGEFRSPGEIFVTSEAYEQRDGGGRVSAVETRTLITTGTSSNDGGVWLPKAQPLPPKPRQARLFVRDLLSVQGTGMNSIPYIREFTPATTEVGASSVSEGGAKPEVAALFETADATARKIAGWLPVTTEIVSDAPTLKGYIDQRLVYMLLLREEQQVLNGSGTAPMLPGIRNVSGKQTQSTPTADPTAIIGLAVADIETVDGDPDGIVMTPTDFWTILTTRQSTHYDGGLGSGNLPFGGPPQTLWGLQVVRSRSMASKSVLVGSWKLGATLFEREAPTVRTLDQHSDYAIYNKLVVLAEERVALAIHRPDFFSEATLP